jgi:hypothetical protein
MCSSSVYTNITGNVVVDLWILMKKLMKIILLIFGVISIQLLV